MLRISVWLFALLISAGILYLLFAPVPIVPRAWQAPPDPGYTGAHRQNQRLRSLNHIDLNSEKGPEHIIQDHTGAIFAAVEGGKLLRLAPPAMQPEIWADTGGRILGFAFDANNDIIAADALRGILKIERNSARTIRPLPIKLPDGRAISYANAVTIAKNGKIYISDASTRFSPSLWGGSFNASILDILEHRGSGRIIEYDPASGNSRVLLRNLVFANGLALTLDETALFVVETGEYRVWRVDLSADNLDAKTLAPQYPKAYVLLDNLPGFPDNLLRGQDGRVWLGLAKPRGKALDNMAGKPFLRKLTLRLPRVFWPVPPAYGHVIAFDDNGRIMCDLQDPSGQYPETTGVLETADRLYIHSLHAHNIGWMQKPACNG